MRITLLNQYYHPDVAATAQLASDLGAQLAARGHEVTAIASARPYAGRAWLPLTDEHRGVKIVRVPATALGRRSRAARALDYGSYLAGLLGPLLLGPPPDVVIALSTPPLVAAMGLLPQLLRGARLVYWVMDLYPDVALELGALKAGSPPARLLGGLQRTLHSRADAVIALDDAMAQRLVQSGVPRHKLSVIDNWVDEDIAPRERDGHPLRRELGLGERFTVSYSGNMGLGHDFETILDAMARLRGEEVSWLFIGDGPRRAELEARAQAIGHPHVRFLPYRLREELPLSLTVADASLVTLGEGFAGLIAPSKLYGLLAAGVPVLYVGPEHGRTAEVIREHAVGLRARNGDGAALAHAVRTLRDDPTLRRQMAHAARALFLARFTRARALARHEALLQRVAAC